jgi:hypothetical protein
MSKLRVSVLSTSATPATFQEGEIVQRSKAVLLARPRRKPAWASNPLSRLSRSAVHPRGALVSIIAEKFWADPTQINPWPASQKFGGILWANSAYGVSSAGCAGS